MANPFFGGAFFGGGFFGPLESAGTIISQMAGRGPDMAEVERIRLQRALDRKKRELRRIAKRVKAVEKQALVNDPPKGILANLHLLEVKQQALQVDIASLYIDLQGVKELLESFHADSFDNDDDDFMDFMNEVKW